MKIHNYLIECDGETSLLFMGGPLEPSETPGKVWLTNPKGERVLEADAYKTQEIDKQKVVEIIIEERKRSRK